MSVQHVDQCMEWRTISIIGLNDVDTIFTKTNLIKFA